LGAGVISPVVVLRLLVSYGRVPPTEFTGVAYYR